jgi:hypothetical protein
VVPRLHPGLRAYLSLASLPADLGADSLDGHARRYQGGFGAASGEGAVGSALVLVAPALPASRRPVALAHDNGHLRCADVFRHLHDTSFD